MEDNGRIITTNADIDAALTGGSLAVGEIPYAIQVRYATAKDAIVVELANGVSVSFPRRLLQGLENASKEQLADIEVLGPGTGLHWPQLDVDHYLPGLFRGLFGTRQWMAELGRQGGRQTTPAKATAARANGRRGGRPSHSAPIVGR